MQRRRTMRGGLAVLAAVQIQRAVAHPACMPGFTQVLPDALGPENGKICPEMLDSPLGICCSPQDELRAKRLSDASMPKNASPQCKALNLQLACSLCDPWAYHLHGEKQDLSKPLMCPEICARYARVCGLGPNYCKQNAVTDGSYCYPFEGESSNGALPRQGDEIKPYYEGFGPDNPLKSNEMRGLARDPTADQWFAFDGKGYIYTVPTDPEATDADVKLVLDMSAKVEQNAELSFQYLALSPDFALTKCMYITYNKAADVGPWNLQVSKLCLQPDGTVPEYPLMEIERPATALYHNGGWIGFDLADMAAGKNATEPGTYHLYFTIGDSTTPEFVQDLTKPYGKMLRMTVGPMGIEDNPQDNPFYNAADPTDMAGKVWAWGLRNPYRCSFNPAIPDYPDLWCGDVGEEAVEKIVRVEKANFYGWPLWEGTKCRTEWYTQEECDAVAFTKPIFEYCHNLDDFDSPVCNNTADIIASYNQPGSAVTGGAFYWADEFAETKMNGSYIFGDFSKQAVMMLSWNGTEWEKSTLYDINDGMLHPVQFVPDSNGDIFMVDVPFTTVPTEPMAGIEKLGCGTACDPYTTIPAPPLVPTTMQPTQIPATPQGGRRLSKLFSGEEESF